MARDLPAALTDVFTPVVIFGMSCFVRIGKQKRMKREMGRKFALLEIGRAGDGYGTQYAVPPLPVSLSLSGSKRSIVGSIHRLLSGWTSGTNLNINSHIQEVSKRRNQEREL